MVFSSIIFIFIFLPVFLLIYYFIPEKLVNPVLILGSMIFYAWGEPVYLILLIFSCIFNYYMGLEMSKTAEDSAAHKYNLYFAVIINLFILVFFKYFGFFMETIGSVVGKELPYPDLALPIGISFYTFKNLSYIFDVYRKKVPAERSLMLYATYSLMFPHIVSGPIVRYADLRQQLAHRRLNIGKLGIGASLFLKGLAKKIILADNLALIYNNINAADDLSFLAAWVGIIAYTLQIYLDFSGYSDMASGLARMLGFQFKPNFDHPYISRSVSEFWRRWHISLGTWFRDYIYIPLGGNRVSVPLHIRNICIVWFLTGLWHGASWNFVIWGLYYGLLLLLEKFVLKNILTRLPAQVQTGYTIFLVVIGWVFFSQTDFSALLHYLSAMFGIGASSLADAVGLYYLKTGFILFIISIISCGDGLYLHFKKLMRQIPPIAVLLQIALFVLCIAYMVYNTYTPFLYLQF